MRLLVAISIIFLAVDLQGQISIQPFQQHSNIDFERKIYQHQIVKHPSLGQWFTEITEDSLETLDSNRWGKKKYSNWFARKLFNEDLIRVDTSNFSLRINPLFNFQVGIDAEDTAQNTLSTNSRGVLIEAAVGKKFSFYTSVWENQSFFPAYISNYVVANGVVPGQGRVKPFKKTGFDYSRSSAVFVYKPFNWLHVQAGHGKSFYGNGYRSLLLSDFSFNYPYLKLGLSMFEGKLLYQPMFASLQHLQRLPSTNSTEAQFVRKAGTFHVLNYQPNSLFEIGIFEGGIYRNWDTTGTVRLPTNYYVPLIGLNSVLNEGDATNYKGIVGVNSRINPIKTLAIYGQIALSTNSSDALGSQFGVKWFDAFKAKNLFLQGEMNFVEADLYHGVAPEMNYVHYNEGLGNYTSSFSNEMIGRVQYSWRDVFIRLKVNNQDREITVVNSNGGVTVSSTVPQNVLISNLELGFLLNRANKMMLLVGMQQRNASVANTTNKSQWIYLAFRTELQNLYFDF